MIPDTVMSDIPGVSLKNYLLGGFGDPSAPAATLLTAMGVNVTFINDTFGIDYVTLNSYLSDYVQGLWGYGDAVLETLIATFESVTPSRASYLIQTLEAGMPCAVPADDFIKKVVDEYNVQDDKLYKLPYVEGGLDLDDDGEVSTIAYGSVSPNTGVDLGGETIYVSAYVDVSVDEAGTVTIEIEYQDDQLDPRHMLKNIKVPGSEDDPNELSDWEWVFPKASDAPTQMKSGDTVFYQTDPIEGPIPGYEVTVILGVSLVSVMGLIYVVMKKRKR
jgi:hypothetical protein